MGIVTVGICKDHNKSAPPGGGGAQQLRSLQYPLQYLFLWDDDTHNGGWHPQMVVPHILALSRITFSRGTLSLSSRGAAPKGGRFYSSPSSSSLLE